MNSFLNQLNQPLFAILITLFTLIPQQSWSWGQRGHHTLCDAAVFLVKEPGLKNYLQNKPNMMGHLCNVPDYHWKNLGSDARKFGDTAHFVDLELLGVPFNQIPTDYKEIINTYTGKENKFEPGILRSIPTEFGSNWWRADQFYKRAIASGLQIRASVAPSNKKEETDPKFPFNKSVDEFTLNIGLMGHYVGDNGQPFHLTADYDGYKKGHGGIHAFYEDDVVAQMPYDLHSKIVKEGQKLQSYIHSKDKKKLAEVQFLKEKTVVEKMRALGELSYNDIEKIFKIDPVITKSEMKEEKGMKIKTAAVRKSAATVSKNLEPLVVLHLARSATLLAQLWDEAYVAIGSPTIQTSKSYYFPLTPDFVMPDYYDTDSLKSETK